MKNWEILRSELKEKSGLGLLFIVLFLSLISLIDCSDHKQKVTATTVPTSVNKLEMETGIWYKFESPGTWYKAEQVRYLNIVDSTINLPTDTIKIKSKGGHLVPYSMKVVFVQDSTSS